MSAAKQPISLTLTLALAIAVVLSAIAVVYTKHEARSEFNELQKLTAERDQLNIQWGQLQIEQSTFATHGRVERIATEKLELTRPAIADIYVIEER